jgi:hypothetical protein
MRKLFSILLLAAICFALPAWADDAPPSHAAVTFDDHGDPVLRAMIAELKRSQEKLQLGQLQRPYYIGDYKQDSYFGEGTGTVDVLPMEDNEMAMRHQLWLATDKAYKAALSGFTEKQAALKNVEHEEDVPDFSQEKASQALRDTSKLGVDLGAWKGRLAATSELFRKDPALQSSSAVYSFRVLNRYFVNTEGTVTRQGRTTYNFAFAGSTQADDGMKLDRSHSYIVTRPDELPKQEEVSKDAEKLISSLSDWWRRTLWVCGRSSAIPHGRVASLRRITRTACFLSSLPWWMTRRQTRSMAHRWRAATNTMMKAFRRKL